MNKKFYPITILEKNGSYIASITELGITTYLNGPDSSEHFNKIFQKLGVSICVDKKCVNPND